MKIILSLALSTMLLGISFRAYAQQQGKLYRIGFLSGGFSGPSSNVEAFRRGLRDLNYVEGKNIVIEYRYAEGKTAARYPELLADLVRLRVDIIVADGSGPTRAAKKATSTIPIVMTHQHRSCRAGAG
jgi:putative tryptophan/tyrosine transport system substrate-binding protein